VNHTLPGKTPRGKTRPMDMHEKTSDSRHLMETNDKNGLPMY